MTSLIQNDQESAATPTPVLVRTPAAGPATTPKKRSFFGRGSAAVLRAFDSWSGLEDISPDAALDRRIDWVRAWPFFALHLFVFVPILVGWSWFAVGTAVLLYVARMFAITGFYHRYFSHRTFKTSRFMQFIFAMWGNSAMQRGPLWWAAHHRTHHRNSDQENDVHSPKQFGFFYSHMGWITSRANAKTHVNLVPDLAKFPELRFIDRFDTLVPVTLGGLLYLAGFLLGKFAPGLGTNGIQLFTWGVISTIVLYHGTFTINSLSHVFGSRRFATGDTSTNNVWLAFVTMGEGWHNNHHHYQYSARQGFYWWEIDITYYGLKVLSWLRLVRDLKPVPAHVFEEVAERNKSRSAV